MPRAAIYARYSSDLQNQSSIDAQLRACRDYCKKSGYEVYREFVDEALSGRSDERPAFQQMIDSARAKQIDVVVCHKIDRFSRDRYDHSHYKRILQKALVRLEYADQHIDDSPEGALTESMLIGLSEYYSQNLARETMKGLNERAYKAKFNGGIPPLGYNVNEEGEYVINEAEATAVRYIFTHYVEGWGLDKISLGLNELGYHPKRGGRFGKNSLHDILHNEKYIGIYRFGRVRRTIDGRRNSHKSDDRSICVPGVIPAIIEQDIWNQVEAKSAKNKLAAGSFSTRRQYMLSGLLRCAKCGHAMVGRWVSARGKSWYVCGQNTRKAGTCKCKMSETSRVENALMKILEETFLDSKKRQELCDKLNKTALNSSKGLSSRINSLETELRSVRGKQGRLLDALEDGLLSADGKERLRALNEREKNIQNDLRQAAMSIESNLVTPDKIAYYVKDFTAAVKEKDPDKIRALLPILVDCIDYDGKSILAHLRVLSFLVPKAGLEPARHR